MKLKLEKISKDIVDKYKDTEIKQNVNSNAKLMDIFKPSNKNISKEKEKPNAVIKDHHPIDSRSLEDYIIGADVCNKKVEDDIDMYNNNKWLEGQLKAQVGTILKNEINEEEIEKEIEELSNMSLKETIEEIDKERPKVIEKEYNDVEKLIYRFIEVINISDDAYDKMKSIIKDSYETRKQHSFYIGEGLKKFYNSLERME